MELRDYQQIVTDRIIGKILPVHDDAGHHYKFVATGTVVDSVTTKNVLEKPFLVPWAARLAVEHLKLNPQSDLQTAVSQHESVKEDASTVGSHAHDVIDNYIQSWMKTGVLPDDIRTMIPVDDYRVFGCCRAAEKCIKENKVFPIASEIIVGDETNGAGTLDFVCLNEDGEIEIWDWKTSNSIDVYYAAQVSAYAKFFESMTGLVVKHCRVIKIDKYTGKYNVYTVQDRETSYQLYQLCARAYDILKGPTLIKENERFIKVD